MPILEVQNITKYFGGLTAIKDLSFSMEAGEIRGMIGPNGAGKTTAFAVISGFYKPDRGKCLFKGEDITGLRPDLICMKGLARTFQLVKPFPEISVLDNIIVGSLIHTISVRKARESADQVLEFMNMSALRDQLAGSLPIALRKRLEIAKALATDPQVILLDETMAGLRPGETEEAIELVRRLSKERGIAILLVEHVMHVIMSLAEQIIVIHHGEKIAEGNPEQIANDEQVIEAYLGEADSDVES